MGGFSFFLFVSFRFSLHGAGPVFLFLTLYFLGALSVRLNLSGKGARELPSSPPFGRGGRQEQDKIVRRHSLDA